MKSQISILAVAAMLSSAGIIGLVSTPQTTSAHDDDSHIVRHHFGFPGALAHWYYDLNLTYDFKTYHFGTVVDNFPAGGGRGGRGGRGGPGRTGRPAVGTA